ncbi:MAG: thymidylate kinase [Oscillospiraceae bacterium]|nr:thymidylate kinase [Oscillospiraceae bacterium]
MQVLFVIDGLDGCGKSTQFELLKEKFADAHFITFPYYNTNSGKIVSDYLGGKFPENVPSVSAYSASAIYAVDRYTSFKTHWQELYESGAPVISARYTTSNAIYQMTKLQKSDWDSYLDWLYDFEYEKLGLPRPDKTVFLDMPVEISQKLLSARYDGDESKKDIHEQNVDFLKACREAALYVAKRDGWIIIPCNKGDEPRTIEEINADLRRIIEKE